MFSTLSCFYVPPATLWKTYFCTDQMVKILQGFALSDGATDPPSLAALCGGSLYLTQQCPLPLSTTPSPERPFMGHAFMTSNPKISQVLSSIHSSKKPN